MLIAIVVIAAVAAAAYFGYIHVRLGALEKLVGDKAQPDGQAKTKKAASKPA